MIVAVVPTCRGFRIPEQTVPVTWIVVHDRQRWPVEGRAIHVVAPDPELFGEGSDSIRSAGFLEALSEGAEYILTVDDDCSIPPTWAESHRHALQDQPDCWWETVPGLRTRGMPYMLSPQKIAISHGLWDGVPDLDARTQLEGFQMLRNSGEWRRIGAPFPQSSMNLGFRAEIAEVMYQPAQGIREPFDRFADIWCGVMAQTVLEKHGYGFMNGGAVVVHQRQSDPQVNLVKERPGMDTHERFWKFVRAAVKGGDTARLSYQWLAGDLQTSAVKSPLWSEPWERAYFGRLSRRMLTWVKLCEQFRRPRLRSPVTDEDRNCGVPYGP